MAAPLILRADEPVPTTGRRISYFMNGEIHVNVPGRPEGKPLTTGVQDGRHARLLPQDEGRPRHGRGRHATARTDFNPLVEPEERQNGGLLFVMQDRVGGQPGQEVGELTNEAFQPASS